MKKLIFCFFSLISFTYVQSQCNSNPISDNGASGTVNFSDSSSVTGGWSTNYSVSYLWDFGDGATSTQQNTCHTYGDLSNISFPLYATLSVSYFDSTTTQYCQDIDSVQVIIFINPCNYGDLQISASGSDLSADWTYSIGSSYGCANNYVDTYLWSNGDTTQTISINSSGTYTCTVTTTTGCVYVSTYSYNGSFTPTFDCSQMDIFEANNNYNILSFQSSYVNNNSFPELIDSLSYWEAYTPDGNICGIYPMLLSGSPSNFSFQNFASDGFPSDSMNICFYAYLYDNYYQHDLSVSPQQGSLCSSCDLFFWDGSNWVTQLINITYDCDLVSGCYDPGTGVGTYASLSACQSNCVVPTTYDCNLVSGCYDPGTGLGTYASLSACQSNCVIPTTYDCDLVSGCYDPGTGLGTYASLSACQSNCFVNSTNEFDGVISRKLMKIVDVYGREINTSKENQPLFYIYDDGSVEKKIIIE